MKIDAHINSVESYYSLKLSPRQEQIVKALKILKHATDWQLSHHLSLPINSITGRVKELIDAKVIIEDGVENIVVDGRVCHRRINRLKNNQETLF
jgi:hypothetical protein